MVQIQRGMVIDIQLDPVRGSVMGKTRPCVVVTNNLYNQRVPVIQVTPITGWTKKKGRIVTNVVLEPSPANGLTKRSVADCLQTRPIDYRQRLVRVRGQLTDQEMQQIDAALAFVFGLA